MRIMLQNVLNIQNDGNTYFSHLSIQFNSDILHAPANEHHVGAHGEEKTKENNKVHECKTKKNQSTMKK